MLSKIASFLNHWYDSTWDWTQVPRAIGKHSNHIYIYIYTIFIWWWRPADFFHQFFFWGGTGIANCPKGYLWPHQASFELSFYLSFALPGLHDPSLSWEYRFRFDSLLSSYQFKWPTHLRLRWASISYMPGSLYFYRMNLFGIYSYHLTFSILRKWRII